MGYRAVRVGVICLALLGLAGFALLSAAPHGKEGHGTASHALSLAGTRTIDLAVLPFENDTDQEALDLLAQGYGADLRATISAASSLNVSAATSSAQLSATTAPAKAGTMLGAAHILTGRLNRVGKTLHLEVHLRESKSGDSLWTERFVHPLQNAPAVHRAILTGLVDIISNKSVVDHVAGPVTPKTAHGKAYRAFLEGLGYAQRNTGEDRMRALSRFHDALSHDASFAEAHAQMALTLIVSAGPGLPQAEETLRQAEQALEETFVLDPDNGTAWFAKGLLAERQDARSALPDQAQALQAYSAARTYGPYAAEALTGLGRLALRVHDWSAAREALDAALLADPLASGPLLARAQVQTALGQYPAARESLMRLSAAQTSAPAALLAEASLASQDGHLDEAVRILKSRAARKHSGHTAFALAVAHACLDDMPAVFAVLDRLPEAAAPGRRTLGPVFLSDFPAIVGDSHTAPSWQAYAAVSLGNRNAAFEALSRLDPSLTSPLDTVPWDRIDPPTALLTGFVYGAFGDTDRQKAFLRHAYDRTAPRPGGADPAWFKLTRAAVHAMTEEPDAALEELEAAIGQGFRLRWTAFSPDPGGIAPAPIERHAYFQTLQGSPAFHRLIRIMMSDIHRMREALHHKDS